MARAFGGKRHVVEHNQDESLDEEQEIRVSEAGAILGVKHTKLAQLLKEGGETGQHSLPFRRSSLDNRVHLVKLRDVQSLLHQSQGITVEEARKHLGVSREKMKHLIESKVLPVRPHPLHRLKRLVDQEAYNKLLKERDAQRGQNT